MGGDACGGVRIIRSRAPQVALGEHLGRYRGAEVVALHLVAAAAAQIVQLAFGFDALGDHAHVEAVGE